MYSFYISSFFLKNKFPHILYLSVIQSKESERGIQHDVSKSSHVSTLIFTNMLNSDRVMNPLKYARRCCRNKAMGQNLTNLANN